MSRPTASRASADFSVAARDRHAQSSRYDFQKSASRCPGVAAALGRALGRFVDQVRARVRSRPIAKRQGEDSIAMHRCPRRSVPRSRSRSGSAGIERRSQWVRASAKSPASNRSGPGLAWRRRPPGSPVSSASLKKRRGQLSRRTQVRRAYDATEPLAWSAAKRSEKLSASGGKLRARAKAALVSSAAKPLDHITA